MFVAHLPVVVVVIVDVRIVGLEGGYSCAQQRSRRIMQRVGNGGFASVCHGAVVRRMMSW